MGKFKDNKDGSGRDSDGVELTEEEKRWLEYKWQINFDGTGSGNWQNKKLSGTTGRAGGWSRRTYNSAIWEWGGKPLISAEESWKLGLDRDSINSAADRRGSFPYDVQSMSLQKQLSPVEAEDKVNAEDRDWLKKEFQEE